MNFIVHENKWPWGYTMDVISSRAEACVKLSFDNDNPGVCFLSGLSVLPQHRRKGFATNILDVCEQLCLERGIFRIDLNSVLTDYVQAFYKKWGFCPIKEENGLIQMYKIIKK